MPQFLGLNVIGDGLIVFIGFGQPIHQRGVEHGIGLGQAQRRIAAALHVPPGQLQQVPFGEEGALDVLGRQTFRVAAQQDVGPTPGHVGRDGDGARQTRLGHRQGLALVILGIQDVVVDLERLELLTETLRRFHRGRADQRG